MTNLTNLEFTVIRNSLTFLHVDELRKVAKKLGLLDKGSKMTIILRILHFKKTGEMLAAPQFPKCSYSQKGQIYPLEISTLMLKGSYKNDLKNRLFFKEVIGNHFHFTAFGIDWLNERWMLGDPPTYQEFANMWKDEYTKRQKTPASPKEEWAYIQFTQNYSTQSSETYRDHLNIAWEHERQRHKNIITEMLGITV
jgi:hypothetical protein